MKYSRHLYIPILMSFSFGLNAQNPFVRDQFSADPTAKVFEDKMYVYPSHDIKAKPGQGRPNWFCMEDYHVFSSENLVDWTDHGMIVSQYKVPWVDSTGFNMWAPDCVEKNGKYYFYFPAGVKDTATFGRGFGIGVAIADHPYGSFVPQPEPINKVHGIDPNVFIDKDGQAYLYWAMRDLYVAKLKDNMTELASEPQVIANLPTQGLKEGPFLFERNGTYYFTYPHVQNKIERLEYAMGKSPIGPFNVTGVIMDESPTGCWTNHQSIVNFKGQWYLFYHHNDYSPKFDKNRSIRVDSLFFNADGSIQKVIPSLRGVGLSNPLKNIEVDRYSKISDGASIDFLDSSKTFEGWKVIFNQDGNWVQYNSVDFGDLKVKSIQLRALSQNGAIIQVHNGNPDGQLISEINVPKSQDWKMIEAPVLNVPKGVQHLVVVLKVQNATALDWIRFSK